MPGLTSMTRLFLVKVLKQLPSCFVCSRNAEQVKCIISEKQNLRLSFNVLAVESDVIAEPRPKHFQELKTKRSTRTRFLCRRVSGLPAFTYSRVLSKAIKLTLRAPNR